MTTTSGAMSDTSHAHTKQGDASYPQSKTKERQNLGRDGTERNPWRHETTDAKRAEGREQKRQHSTKAG